MISPGPTSPANLSCVVFMPFSDTFSFVYELAIKPALMKCAFTPHRADETHVNETRVIDDDQVRRLLELLRCSDLVIADISGGNQNVLWELGFAHALSKPTIILSQTSDAIPFNIKTRNVLFYRFSNEGVSTLGTDLQKLIEGRYTVGASLGADDEVSRSLRSLSQGISQLDRDSILRSLVKNELARLTDRIDKLQSGRFDLRNAKPNSEIMEYFCDYVAQLNSSGASYHTVSTYDFWKAITLDGHKFRYLDANVEAAQAGAKIFRVFLIDREAFSRENVSSVDLFSRVLKQHYDATQRSEGRIQTRVHFTQDYRRILERYPNFAIWERGDEQMLFEPVYDDRDSMQHTDFWYYRQRRGDVPGFTDNKDRIARYKKNFLQLWDSSPCLEPKHFDHLEFE